MPELMPYQALYMNMDLFGYVISKHTITQQMLLLFLFYVRETQVIG